MSDFYICECGAVFEEPARREESRGEFWGVPCSETVYLCPTCGSDVFCEAGMCDGCGEWVALDDICFNDGLCDKCYKLRIEKEKEQKEYYVKKI